MITGFHKLNSGSPLRCRTDGCNADAKIALHEQWQLGEPVDFQRGSSRFLFLCEPCAHKILEQEKDGIL